METYRLFVAVEAPPDVKAELAAAQERLRRTDAAVKWVAPEALHMTLHFLGETDVELLPRLGAALRAALAGHTAVAVRLDGIGAFPNLRRPSIVWAGIGGATAALERVYVASGAALEALGLPRDARPFRAHLTLGRVRREAAPAQLERLGRAIRSLPPFAPVPWVIERVVLFRSELRPSGPVYTALETAPLV
ncbi:MAG TPA: RNA 2',3'-cyclic phosphodiesterase [Roseiflexaceae bacterium]